MPNFPQLVHEELEQRLLEEFRAMRQLFGLGQCTSEEYKNSLDRFADLILGNNERSSSRSFETTFRDENCNTRRIYAAQSDHTPLDNPVLLAVPDAQDSALRSIEVATYGDSERDLRSFPATRTIDL